MQRGVGKGDAILIEVVANRYFTAERIASAIQIHFIVIIVAGLNHDGHVEISIADGIDDTDFKTEVWQ